MMDGVCRVLSTDPRPSPSLARNLINRTQDPPPGARLGQAVFESVVGLVVSDAFGGYGHKPCIHTTHTPGRTRGVAIDRWVRQGWVMRGLRESVLLLKRVSIDFKCLLSPASTRHMLLGERGEWQ